MSGNAIHTRVVTISGEKSMSNDFEIVSRTCRIVGARIRRVDG